MLVSSVKRRLPEVPQYFNALTELVIYITYFGKNINGCDFFWKSIDNFFFVYIMCTNLNI